MSLGGQLKPKVATGPSQTENLKGNWARGQVAGSSHYRVDLLNT